MSVLTFNCVRAGCLQAIEVIKVLLCPDIAVSITEHAAKRKENNLRRKYDVEVVVEVEAVEEENVSKKRRVYSSDETKNENKKESANKNKIESADKYENENENKSESSSSGRVIKSKSFAPLINRQVLFDASEGEFHNFNLPPLNPLCAICGPQSTIFNMEDCAKDLDFHLQRVYQVINIISTFIIYCLLLF